MNVAAATAQSIPSRFAEAAARHARRMAVKTSGLEWTYAELDARSNAVAIQLLDRLGDAAETVALLLEHDAPLLAAILGALKAGKSYLALDPSHPQERLSTMLVDSNTPLLLTDDPNAETAHTLAAGRRPVMRLDEIFTAASRQSELPNILPEAAAWLMYTSGSTGTPKGVWQNHSALIHQTEVYTDLAQIVPDDCLSLLTSCGLSASSSNLFGALLNGATLCPFHVRSQGVERLAIWMRDQRITVYHSVPTIFRHLSRIKDAPRAFETVRLVRLGGEPVLRGDVEIFRQQCPDHCRLMHSLSSTETGLIAALILDKQTALPYRRIPVGLPVHGAEVSLLDQEGREVNGGQEGRIAVKSAHLRQGYWRTPDATMEQFKDVARDANNRIFVTGDLGRLLPDGMLEHRGRADRVVKIRGQRVDLEEVEAALQILELFEEAAAGAVEEASGELRLVAYVVPRVGQQASSQTCRRLLRQTLPEHLIPNEFVSLAALPQTPGGKIDRQALAQMRGEPAAENTAKNIWWKFWPHGQANGSRHRRHDGIEKKLTNIWESVLGVSPIRPQDDFFDLGGTSLQSSQVLAQVEERFNVALPPSALFGHSTIAAVAPLLADQTVLASPRPLVPLSRSTAGRPLFLMHNGQGNITTYGQLVRRLPGRPIYGLQATGLQGEGWPLLSIPAMASRYLREILAVDPTGPYLLAGTCMGGLIAFETARQLVQQGHPVGLVALLDSNHPQRPASTAKLMEDSVRDGFRILRGGIIRATGLKRRAHWLRAYRTFVVNMTSRAHRFYRPLPYPGTVTLILSANTTYPGEDLRLMMSRFARDTKVIKISGQRGQLFVRPAVEELASQMQNILEAAQK